VSAIQGKKQASETFQSLDPIFGMIEDPMGFRRFNLWSREKVSGE